MKTTLNHFAQVQDTFKTAIPRVQHKGASSLFAQMLTGLFLTVALSGSAQAANSDTWTGGGGNATWSTALNWTANPTAPPSAGDTAIFNAGATTVNNNTSVTLGAATSILNITFDSNAAAYTIGATGGPTLTLGSGGVIQSTSAVSNTENIGAPISLTGSATFTSNAIPAADTLNFQGGVSSGSGADTLTLNGSNTGANTISGNITTGAGSVAVTKSGTGTWVLTGTDTYSGATTVSAGTLQIGNGTAGSISGASTVAAAGTESFDMANNATYSGTIADSGTVVGAEGSGITNTLTGISGSGKFTQGGLGTTVLSGVNGYTGATTGDNGALQLNFAGTGSPATNIIGSTSALTLAGGGTLSIQGKSAATNSQTFASTAVGFGSTASGALGGADTISFTQNSATSLSAALGALTRNAGTTVNFILPTTGTVTASSASGNAGTSGVILGYADVAFATVNGNDWAALSSGTAASGNIVGLSSISGGYTLTTATSLGASGANADVALGVTATSVSGPTIETLRFNQSQATTITITGGNLSIGGILVTAAVGAHTTTINGAGGIIPYSHQSGNDFAIIQNNPLGALVISALLPDSHVANLTVSGDGTVDITNTANTYTGATYINGTVIVNIAADTNLGAAPATATVNDIVFNGGTLQLGAAITLNANRGITLGNSGGATIDTNSFNGSYGGIIASAANETGGLTKVGSGTLTLSGANTYSGVTTVTSGTLQIGNGASGSISNSASTISGGTESFDMATGSTYSGTIANTGTVSGVETTGVTNTLSGAISGTGGAFAQTGAGTTILSGVNTYTGATTVSAGKVVVTSPSTISTTGGLSVGAGTTFDYAPTTAGALNTGVLTLTGGSGTRIGTALGGTASQSVIASTGAAVTSGAVAVDIYGIPGVGVTSGSNNLITATSGLTGATYTLGNVYNATNFTVSGLTSASGAISITATSQAALTNEYWQGGFSGGNNVWAISNGSTTSNWSSSATSTATSLTPGTATTVNFSVTSGTAAANEGSTVLGANMSILGLVVSDTTAVGLNADGNTLTIGTGGITVNGGAGAVTLNAPLITGGAQSWTNNSGNTLTIGGAVSGENNLTVNGSGNTTISGVIATGGGTFTKSGTGTATIAGANTYIGATAVSGGTLQIGSGNAGSISSSSVSTVALGATESFGMATGTTYSGTIADLGTVSGVETGGVINTLSGVVSGTGGAFTQAGAGTTILSGADTYNGATTVDAGILQVDGSLASGSAVTVGGTGATGTPTLSGAGTVNGTVSVATAGSGVAGTISPGDGSVIGTLSTGALTFGSGSTWNAYLATPGTGNTVALAGGKSNKLAVTGNLTNVSGETIAPLQASTGTIAAGAYLISTYTGTDSGLSSVTVNAVGSGATVLHGVLVDGGAGTTGSDGIYLDEYRLATATAPSASAVLGNVRVGTNLTGTASITNNSANAFSESLQATIATNGTGFTGVAGGTSGSVTYSLATTTAGAKTGTATVVLASTGVGNNANTTLSSTAVSLSGAAYDYANANYTGATLNFGNVHVGATVAAQSVAFGNQTVTNAAYQDSLNVSATTGNSAVTATGFTALAASTGGATTSNLTLGVNTSSVGSLASTEALTLVSNDNGVAGLSNGTPTVVGSPAAITTTGQVYSGLMVWSGASGGTWATNLNWNDSQSAGVHVAPGLDPSGLYNNTDTATFDNTTGSGGTVNLGASSPSLKAITFSGANGYILAQGAGGTGSLLLNGTGSGLDTGGNNALVQVTTGTHTISAPISLTTSSDVTVASGQQLTISGAVSSGNPGTGLAINGAGTTILSSSTGNSYSGATAISGGGKTYLTSAVTGGGAVTVSGANSMLGLSSTGSVSGAITLSGGGSLYSGATAPTGAQVAANVPGLGTTSGATLSSALNVNGGNLTFALANTATSSFASPATSTSYLTTSSTVSFTGTDSITLVDLSNGNLSLRMNQPYLLISANSSSMFSGLVVETSTGAIGLSQNGFQGLVLGVSDGSGNPLGYTTITIDQFGSDGVTPLANTTTADPGYYQPSLYLVGGDLEVVPEPGTWALMLGGLALLVVIQRRKNQRG